jgi:PAS domain S-box-containing protein
MGPCDDRSENQPATVTVDRAGTIRQWGEDVTKVVGHSADDTLGRNLNIIIPPALRSVHWWGFDRAMRRGRMSSGKLTVPALRNDGRIVVAHATIELTFGDSGATDGATVTFNGTAPRWQSRAWQVALAPINVAHRAWHRGRSPRNG